MSRGDARPGSGVRTATLVVAILTLLPVGYVFNGYRTSNEDGRQVNAVQRAAVDYLRPLASLLAALVDVQDAAARRAPLVADPLHEAIKQVDHVDSAWGDALAVRQRWSQLRDEIESTLGRPVSGPDAVGVYAEPVGLAQALFSRIGDASMIAGNSEVDAQYLVETAVVGLPEVIVNASQLAGLAGSRATPADPRIAVALDRVTRAVRAIRVGPHSGADQAAAGAATMGLLEPLDEFTAAADGLMQAVSLPDLTASQARTNLDLAVARVRLAALRLDAAVLDELKLMLQRRLVELDAQRRNTSIAGVLILVAGAALVWLSWLGPDGWNRWTALRGRERAEPGRAGGGRSTRALPPWEAR